MNMTNYLRSKLGDHSLTGESSISPGTIYLALYTVAPDETGGGTEVTGGSYGRAVITFTETATAGEYTNDLLTIDDMPTASVVGIGILDTFAGGDLLFFDSFTAVEVTAGDTYVVAADTMTITFT